MNTTDRPLSIAFIHQPWSVIVPPMKVADSVGIWTDQVARRLAESCQVISYSRRGAEQTAEQRYAGVTYRRFAAPVDRAVRFLRLLDEWKLIDPRRGFMTSRWFYHQYYAQVVRDLVRQRPDIVHIQNFSQFVPIVRRHVPSARIVLHMHAEWLTEHAPALIAPRITQADAVITCSNYFRNSVRAGWPGHAEKCRTVYNGVDLDEFAGGPSPARNGRRILFVGRVCPDKGVHVLVRAFAKVLERFPDAALDVVGPILQNVRAFSVNLSNEPAVRDLARWYHRPYVGQLHELMPAAVRERVRITGEVSREQLIEHYRLADVLALPSIYAEGFGIPIIEAAALATPTVATRRGGMPEVVVDGKTGFLVEAGDVPSLAGAMIRLLENPAERRAMGAAARQRAMSRFTWDRIAQDVLDEYEQLLQSRGGTPSAFPDQVAIDKPARQRATAISA
jgi:glycosyltransferase involved in cell wall biosynthesis